MKRGKFSEFFYWIRIKIIISIYLFIYLGFLFYYFIFTKKNYILKSIKQQNIYIFLIMEIKFETLRGICLPQYSN